MLKKGRQALREEDLAGKNVIVLCCMCNKKSVAKVEKGMTATCLHCKEQGNLAG